MKIVVISDTHCMLDRITIPDGDILVHCGDLTWTGKLTEEIIPELNLLGSLPHKHKILIPGNHEKKMQGQETVFDLLCKEKNINLLINKKVSIEGINFFGSPYTPAFGSWGYMYDRANGALIWECIPEDTNILITHGPPKGILDKTEEGDSVGCHDLLLKTQTLPNLKYHLFGHIHEGYGQVLSKVNYINASCVNRQYRPINKPFIFYYNT